MRFVALILGLTAGIFALATPVAFKSDLLTPFVEYWAATADGRLAAVLTWYALPLAAILGGILAVVGPGFAAWLLLGAAAGWLGIGAFQPELTDFKLLVPAGSAGLAGVLAFLAGELDIHRRRRQRREQRAVAVPAVETAQIEREAAFRIDPTLAPRQNPAPRETAAPPPRRTVPLKFEDMSTTSPLFPPAEPPPRAAARDEIWPAPSGGRRPGGFQWDEGDEPSLEPDREQPRPSPRLEQREVPRERVPFVSRPTARHAEIQPEMRGDPRPVQQPYRRPIPQRRNDSLAGPIIAGIAAVLVVTLLAGVYVAYREGYIDRIVAAIQSPTITAPATIADTTVATPAAPGPVPAATPAPASGITAVSAPTLPLVLPEAPAATGAPGAAETSYDDPFAYCAAVGTIDHFDSRYRGPAVTPAMTQALRAPETAGRDRVHWRCVEGTVMACASYAGPICDATPSVTEMQAYCERNPDARPLFAPHGIWSCVGGKPQLPPEANWPVDEQGFMPRAWLAIRPPAPTNG